MPLPFPAKHSVVPADASKIRALLDTIIAGRPTASSTYQFYEEVDLWLGPWGPSGYPIGYGKKYNLLFAHNTALMRDRLGKAWTEKTTVLLQESLRDEIVKRVSLGTLPKLTEAEFRDAAFDSHPDAYLKAGLLEVIEKSPELLLVILTIPYEQFNPSNPNFVATLKQIKAVITKPSLRELFIAMNGVIIRSHPLSVAARQLWIIAASKVPGIPVAPGSADDNFADSLGLLGGLINAAKP